MLLADTTYHCRRFSVPVTPSETIILCGLTLSLYIPVMSNEGGMSQAEPLGSISTCPTPGGETGGPEQWPDPTAHPVPGD